MSKYNTNLIIKWYLFSNYFQFCFFVYKSTKRTQEAAVDYINNPIEEEKLIEKLIEGGMTLDDSFIIK